MKREPPPARLPPFGNIVLPSGTILHRIHKRSQHYSATDFNPCLGRRTRFAPLRIVDPATPRSTICVPTLYAGQTFEAALWETVFRDLPPLPNARLVFERTHVAGASHAEITIARDLTFGALFEPNLHLIGLTRRRLIECYGDRAYRWTVTWATAIHRDFSSFDGLAWTSRQHDPAQAYLLFGDRANATLQLVNDRPIDTGTGYAQLQTIAARFRITLVPTP